MILWKNLLPFILITATITISSCTDKNFTIGGSFIDDDLRVICIDTSTVAMSTMPVDSLVTSGNEMILTGNYQDSITGKTTSTSYVTYTVPSALDQPESSTLVFDSVQMILVYNGEWTGDTSVYQDFNIYRLDQAVILPEDEELYNNHSVSYASAPIASFSVRPRPESKDTISVKMPYSFGADLFKKLADDDEVIGTQDRFNEYLEGFAIAPGKNNNCTLGFCLSDTSMAMKIYYHYIAEERVKLNILISPLQSNCYYGTKTDRTGTPFKDLKKTELRSEKSGNSVLIQSLTASYIKFDIPYLKNLLETGQLVNVISATLKITPAKRTYSAVNPLPAELTMYTMDKNDVTTGYIINYAGDALQTGNLKVDDINNTSTYSYDITDYINEQLGALPIDKKYMTITVPQTRISKCLKSLVLNDKNSVELKLTYILYND
jgi:hypothetical protein